MYLYYKINETVGIEKNEDQIIINYSDNLNHPKNEYNFLYIPKNEPEKSLIINNFKNEKVRFRINYCSNPNTIKMHFHPQQKSAELTFEFNKDITMVEYENEYNLTSKLSFDSTEDFVFSYSFIDQADIDIDNNEEWINERNVSTDLTIKEIIQNEKDFSYTIKFNPNYKYSTTR